MSTVGPLPKDKSGKFIKEQSICIVVNCKHDDELEDLDDKVQVLKEKLVEAVCEAVKDSPIKGKVLAGVRYTNKVKSFVDHFKLKPSG